MDVLDFQFKLHDLDVKSGVFRGYASTLGGPPDLQGDRMIAGAFTRTLKERGSAPIPILWSHRTDEPIGAGEAKEDSHGLAVSGELVLSVARAVETRDLMKAGIVTGLSIGYSIPSGGCKQAADGVRELLDIDLYEFSACVFPACPTARVTAPPKSLAAMTPADWDAHFRSAGWSKRETERLVYAVRGVVTDPAEEAAVADLVKWFKKRKEN